MLKHLLKMTVLMLMAGLLLTSSAFALSAQKNLKERAIASSAPQASASAKLQGDLQIQAIAYYDFTGQHRCREGLNCSDVNCSEGCPADNAVVTIKRYWQEPFITLFEGTTDQYGSLLIKDLPANQILIDLSWTKPVEYDAGLGYTGVNYYYFHGGDWTRIYNNEVKQKTISLYPSKYSGTGTGTGYPGSIGGMPPIIGIAPRKGQ